MKNIGTYQRNFEKIHKWYPDLVFDFDGYIVWFCNITKGIEKTLKARGIEILKTDNI